MIRKAERLLSLILSICLLMTLLPVSALAEAVTAVHTAEPAEAVTTAGAAYSDTASHWAAAQIAKWSGLGILKGYEGKFRPDDPITRGEMAVVNDRVMRYQTAAANTFSDLGQAFYTDALLKANAAGVMTGYNGKIRPTDNITREEAVTMLGRALGLAESVTGKAFADADSISAYARGFVNALSARGFVAGYDGKFRPQSPITRAEVVKILDNAVAGLYSTSGEYSQNASGIVIINAPDVTLKNMTITGDLIIAQGVGNGEATLNNVTVTGNTIIRGGGANSIHITGNSSLTNIIIEKTDDGQVRVVTADGVEISALYIDDGRDDVILDGSFANVILNADINVIITENTVIDKLTVNSTAQLTNNGTVTAAIVNADGVVISGNKPETLVIGSDVTVVPVDENGSPLNEADTSSGGSEGIYSPTYHILSFNSNGGETIADRAVTSGAVLGSLPTPYKMDAVFLGWYKDSGLSIPVSSTDTISEDLTLYAKYAASAGFPEVQSIPEISRLDQDIDFTITVEDSTKSMTEAAVIAGITFASPSNPDFPGIEVLRSGDDFIISAQGGYFEEGGTYKLTLNDDNLFFKGEDESTRICNFTIARAPVMNVSLNKGMKYIAADQISGMTQNGFAVSTLSVPLVRIAGTGTDLSTVDLESGTFEYAGGGINVGDTVAIYEGTRPDERDLNTSGDDAGSVAYVTITAINGTTYSYVKADEKNVLFTPDVLPVSTAADTDGDPDNNSITVPKGIMTYTTADYAEVGLNAATAVDAGDYIAFYTGTFGPGAVNAGYAEITAVTVIGDNYIIAYEDTTLDTIMAAMSLHNTRAVDGDELLENVDVSSLEEGIEQQAIQSGFVDEAAIYLADLAMKTDGFKQLSLAIPAGGTYAKGQPMLAAAGGKPQVKKLKVSANVNKYLQRLNGTGARVTLTISCDVVFKAAGDDNTIVIRLSGAFEQEIGLSLDVNGDAVWKLKDGWLWYIEDYRLNANIDIGDYTGININASIGTFENEAEYDLGNVVDKFKDISGQIKDIMDNKKPDDSVIADTLAAKYKAMLEDDSDWINLYEKELFSFEQAVDPFHILVFGLDINFVVGAKMNVSVGCDFSYQNAKRYIFTVNVFANTATSDTIDIIPEQYDFRFYIMGTLGLRAGISLELKVGLFSLDLDSVGIEGEVGAYIQLWGYFYYEVSYRQATGKISRYAGALYLEFGIYLEISFVAQAISGMFEYEATLYENQWPLLSFGSQENVFDFAYSADETPNVSMAKQTKSFVLPDSVFNMSYMDMKSGETVNKSYDSGDFDFQITNSDFAYDPATKTVTVNPGEKDITEGNMVLTWKGNPVAFTSVPIARAIRLHWEDLKDAYTISFNSCGGSVIDAIALPYNSAITPLANDPEKMGYVFGGWYRDEALTQAYTIPAAMPAEDIILYARWEPANDTKYRVEHYLQNHENDLYTLAETEYYLGITEQSYPHWFKVYEGFSNGIPDSGIYFVKVLADGSAVLKYYYKRNSYTLTFDSAYGNKISETTVKFGAPISAPLVTRPRNSFAGWLPALPETMPAQDLYLTAQWTTIGQIDYKVEHYQENLSGGYILSDTDNLSDILNQTVTATAKNYPGFTYNRTASGTVVSGTVTADGSLVLKLYYTRNSYTLTFDANGGTGGGTRQAKFGEAISAPEVTMDGYLLTGWSPAVPATMPAADATYVAQWTEDGSIAYTVEHYLENLYDGYTLTEVENLKGADGSTVTASAKNYTGFTHDSSAAGAVESGTIMPDGGLVLKLYYTRDSVTLTFDANGGSTGSITVDKKYGSFVGENEIPSPGTLEGFAFTGWSPAFTGITPAADSTYVAQWTTNISGELDFTTETYASQDMAVGGVDWKYATKTLTLTNAAITAADSTESGTDNFAIKVPDGTTIILEGRNYLKSGMGRGGTNSSGVLCDGDLTIQGTGTLTALGTPNFMSLVDQAVCYGINASGTVTIQGTTVIAKSWGATGNSCGIFAENIVISSSTVYARGGESAIGACSGLYANGNISVSNSTVIVPNGIYAEGDVTLSQSTVNAFGSKIRVSDDFKYYGIYGDNVTITGGAVSASSGENTNMGYGIYAITNVVISSGAAVTARYAEDAGGVYGSGCGIFAETGSISISGSSVAATGKDVPESQQFAAMNKAPTLINAEASRASENSDGSDGVSYNPNDIATYRYVQIRAK